MQVAVQESVTVQVAGSAAQSATALQTAAVAQRLLAGDEQRDADPDRLLLGVLRHDHDQRADGRPHPAVPRLPQLASAGLRLLDVAADGGNPGQRRRSGRVPGSGRADGRDADRGRLAERHHRPGSRRGAGLAAADASVRRPDTAGDVAAPDRLRLLLRRYAAGPAGAAVDHDHQRAGRPVGLEPRRHRRDRSDHLASAGRLRRLVLRRDAGAGRHRAEHRDRGRDPCACESTTPAPADLTAPDLTAADARARSSCARAADGARGRTTDRRRIRVAAGRWSAADGEPARATGSAVQVGGCGGRERIRVHRAGGAGDAGPGSDRRRSRRRGRGMRRRWRFISRSRPLHTPMCGVRGTRQPSRRWTVRRESPRRSQPLRGRPTTCPSSRWCWQQP